MNEGREIEGFVQYQLFSYTIETQLLFCLLLSALCGLVKRLRIEFAVYLSFNSSYLFIFKLPQLYWTFKISNCVDDAYQSVTN